MKTDREQWVDDIKQDPALWAKWRLGHLSRDDVNRLLRSLAATYGIGEEIEDDNRTS